jgi:hypothetical protein
MNTGLMRQLNDMRQMGTPEDDPRLMALEQYLQQTGYDTKGASPPMMFPGMKGEDELDAFEREKGMPNTKDRLANPRRNLMEGMNDGRGAPNDVQGAREAAEMSDEDLLAAIQGQMGKDGGPPAVPGGQQPNYKYFTGDIAEDLKTLDDLYAQPRTDYEEIEAEFEELHGKLDADDRKVPPEDEPDDELDKMRR